jgi:hypothetical protein
MRSPITTRATVPPSTHAAVQDNMATVSFDCPSSSRSALLMVRPGLATDGCRAQYRLSPLLAQTILWWNTVLGYRLWCFAPLVGFADSAAAQPRLLRSLVSFADLCVLTGSTWKMILTEKFSLGGGCSLFDTRRRYPPRLCG